MENLKVLVIRESIIESLLADTSTFGFLLFTSWFNYKFIESSKFVFAVVLIMFIMFIMQKSKSKVFTNKEDAINYIKEE